MSRYAVRPAFDPSAAYVSLKQMQLAGTAYQPGDPVRTEDVHPRMLRNLYDARRIEMVLTASVRLTPELVSALELAPLDAELRALLVAQGVLQAPELIPAVEEPQEAPPADPATSAPVEAETPLESQPSAPAPASEGEAQGETTTGEPSPDNSPAISTPEAPKQEPSAASTSAPTYRVVKVGMGGWRIVNVGGEPIGSSHGTKKAAEAALVALLEGAGS